MKNLEGINENNSLNFKCNIQCLRVSECLRSFTTTKLDFVGIYYHPCTLF